jgi:AcrR family transcriptional regulator
MGDDKQGTSAPADEAWQQTSLRILDAADELFYGEGIQAVGVDAIAARAGVSKRTLYKHFASKETLLAAYLERRSVRTTGSYREQGPEGDPLAQMLAVYDNFEKRFADPAFRGCPFVNAVAELGGGDPQQPALGLAREFKLGRRRWFETRLRALGVTKPRLLADQLVILVEGAIATSLVRGGDPSAARAAGAAARVLLRSAGIVPRARRH